MRTILALCLLAVPAFAQKKAAPNAPKAQAAPKAQHLDIDDDEVVEGGVPSGSGDVVTSLRKRPPEGMIKIRQDFKPEMYATALNL